MCVAHAPDGRAVLVRHALPGERVRAVVTGVRRSFLRADAVEAVEASPERVQPPCPWAGPGKCGGCDWQHASLPEQRRLKATVVAEQLHRLAGLDVPVDVAAVPGDDDGLGWRTRMRFAVADGRAGLHRHRSSTVEPIGDCLIAHPAVGAASVVSTPWPGADEVLAEVAAGGVSTVTPVPPGPPHGATVVEHAAGRDWLVPAGGFWQVHPGAADALVAAVLDLVQPRPGEQCLDLYAGVGLFAGAVGVVTGGRVTAVESDRRATAAAVRNLADLPGAQVVTARVESWTHHRRLHADVVVLDPPRRGAGAAVVAAIAGARPRAVSYVACDPAALARDVATFAAHGYRLTAVRAFDLFPMTAHVECVAVLEPA